MSKTMKKYSEAKKKMKAALKEANDIVKSAFTEAAQDVFNTYPKIESFSWTQYTPYFNDGDTCVFRTATDYPELTFTDETSIDTNMGDGDADEDAVSKEIRGVKNFLSNFDDDDYETMFGDHAKVTVTRTNIEVDEYDHD